MKVVLEILVLATVLDGKVSRKERTLYDAAVEVRFNPILIRFNPT